MEQGSETTQRQLIAEELGIPIESRPILRNGNVYAPSGARIHKSSGVLVF
jgi:hypothetical protein